MNKLHEQKRVLDSVINLIEMMDEEINYLRHVVNRYYNEHGQHIKDGASILQPHETFAVIERKGQLLAEKLDYKKLGIESRYEKIKRKINELSN